MKVDPKSNIEIPDFDRDYRPIEETYHQWFIDCLHRNECWQIDLIALLSNMLIFQKYLEAA